MPLSLDTTGVIIGNLLPAFKSSGNLLNAENTFQWVMKRNDLLGWTYTIQPGICCRFRRLITGRPLDCVLANVRTATNCHIKCYIAKDSAVLGSFNLTLPTILDLSILITNRTQLKALRELHRSHWAALA